MFGNFKNGIYALGVFTGFALTIFTYISSSFFSLSVDNIFFNTIFGVLLGAVITIFVSIFFRTREIRDNYCDVATVFQIRATANVHLLILMKKSIENSRKSKSIPELLPYLSEDLHWLVNFFPTDASLNFEVLSTSEAATLMRVMPSDKKRI